MTQTPVQIIFHMIFLGRTANAILKATPHFRQEPPFMSTE